MLRHLVCEGTHATAWLFRENILETTLNIVPPREIGKVEPNLRSFVIDQTTEYGNPGIASLINILSHRLLHEVSVDADPPSKIQSVRGEDCRSCVYSVDEGGVWSSTETFQSVHR